MKTYRNVDHAVSSAVSVGSVGVPAAAKWQSQYSTGFVESLTAKNDDTIKMSRSDRLHQAAITARAIHKLTSEIQWAAFLAKHSQFESEQVSCIQQLADYVSSDMPRHFILLSVSSWASTALRKLITEKILTMDSEKSRRTIFRRRDHIHKQLRYLEWSALASLGMPLEEDGLFEDDGDE
jgi:hypothetical protein